MALRNPPSWLQAGSHTAENDRYTTQAVVATAGVIGTGAFAVAAQASPNMTVQVAAGWAGISGTAGSGAGIYMVYNDASTNATISTADPTNPRIDRVCLVIADSAYTGSSNSVSLTVVTGTPAASPSAPATPANAISLATIAVAANATTITNANITDTRAFATSALFMNPPAGNTLNAPLKLTAGTNLTTASAGAVEYDGTSFYATPSATTGRALSPASHLVNLQATKTLTGSSAAAQNLFNLTTGLALSANTTYEVEIVTGFNWSLTTASTTSFAFSFTYSGGATNSLLTGDFSVGTTAASASLTTTGSLSTSFPGTFAASAFSGALSATTYYGSARIKGTIRTAAAGNLMPQITCSSTNAASLSQIYGSYIKLTPIGGSAATNIIGAWA